VQYLHDHNLVYRGHGAIVLVRVAPQILASRFDKQAGEAARRWYIGARNPETDVLETGYGLPEIEAAIRAFNMPYYQVHNTRGAEGFARAACALGNYAGLKE
jgi:hypothetical protein